MANDRTFPTRFVKLVGLLLAAWCVMTFTHEAGHIVGGWLSGGVLKDADLYPWHLPYSFFDPDPRPLITLWSGPVLGVLIPVFAAALFRRRPLWFIADFCMLANGVYLGLAWLSGERLLDTARLLEAGAWPVAILVYCAVTIGVGYVRFRRDCINTLDGPFQAIQTSE